MADYHTGRLCAQIVHSHFGPITASIASTLLTRGRLPFPQLVRLTGKKPRTVLASILVLIQHNLLWHSTTSEEGEVLEVNVEECLARLGFGRFIQQAEQLFGKPAADVIEVVLDHGKLRPPEILDHLVAVDSKSKALYNQAIHKLVTSSYLKPSTILSHQSARDKQIKYEAEERAKMPGLPTAKELRQAKEIALARLRREEEEAEQVGLKRKAKTLESLNKKRDVKTEVDIEMVVEETVYFRVNYDKFNIHLRNSLIVKAAKERFNQGAAEVLEAALSLTEASQKDVREIRSDPISLPKIIWKLSENTTISSGLIYSSKKIPNSTYIKDYLGMLSSADNPSPAGKAAAFVSFSSSKVHVEFEIVHRRLRRRVMESVAREKHGVEGVRIISLLLDSGKLEEKQISKVVMMAPKDVRTLLMALAADSLVSTQEVPKTADRNPTRTFYLWYVDLQKAYSVILDNLYKTLYNIGTRRLAENEVGEVKAVLEKCERSDVMEDDSLLSRHEKTVLDEWEVKQKKLTVLGLRVEETVFILKELGEAGRVDD